MAGQTYQNSSQFYGNQLSDVLRLAVEPLTKFRQVADSQISSGRHRGNTFSWSIMGDIATPGGILSETVTMPVGTLTVAQGTLTVSEFGQALNWSRFLEDLSKFSIEDALGVALTNDCAKTLDRQVWGQFKQTALQIAATAGSSNSAVTLYAGTSSGSGANNVSVTNNVAMTLAHVRAISNLMKGRNIPAYRGQDYYCIARPATFESLQSPTSSNNYTNTSGDNLQGVHQYTATGLRYIMEGEIGRYRNVRFIEQTNIGAGIGNTGLDPTFYSTYSDMVPWTNAASDWAYFFGEDTVIEGIVVPEQLLVDIPHDFFRSKYLGWYYTGGFSLTQFQTVNSRVLWWNSAT